MVERTQTNETPRVAATEAVSLPRYAISCAGPAPGGAVDVNSLLVRPWLRMGCVLGPRARSAVEVGLESGAQTPAQH